MNINALSQYNLSIIYVTCAVEQQVRRLLDQSQRDLFLNGYFRTHNSLALKTFCT